MKKLRENKGITLIALIITIIVMLILVGVTVTMAINGGLFENAGRAAIETRAGNVEEEVEIWKSTKRIAKYTNGETESEEDMLARLKEQNLITENDEIDTLNRIIKIKKKNGEVVKEISYSMVNINISKTPEKDATNAVMLEVTSVDGLPGQDIKTEEDLLKFIEELDEEESKEIIKNGYIIISNEYMETNFSTFSEVVEILYKQGEISENTEEAFWQLLEDSLTESGMTLSDLTLICFVGIIEISGLYDESTGEIKIYYIINPDNSVSNTYIAKENGTYTFTVKDLIFGETYTKTVEVTNIDYNLDYFVSNDEGDYSSSVVLKDKDTEELTTFEEAYVIYNGETIDISSIISQGDYRGDYFESDEFDYVNEWGVAKYLAEYLGLSSAYKVEGNTIGLVLVKDSVAYCGIRILGPFLS